MRVGIVRSDIGHIYLSDVESRVQRNFSSEPAGQSRMLFKPTDAQLLVVLNTYAFLAALGTNNAATSNTTGGNNVLRIRTSASLAYTVITVTSDAALPKATLVSELNTAFVNAGLKVQAYLGSAGTANQILLVTTAPNSGPSAYLQIDTAANGSTLNTLIHPSWGVTPPVLSGLSVAALKAAVYPSATTVNVASGTIGGLSSFNDLSATLTTQAMLNALVAAIQDIVAPKLVETGPAILSFVYGNLSKLRSASFQPGGARVGLPAGVGVHVVQDDGSTTFTI